jgi:hypothetical protein
MGLKYETCTFSEFFSTISNFWQKNLFNNILFFKFKVRKKFSTQSWASLLFLQHFFNFFQFKISNKIQNFPLYFKNWHYGKILYLQMFKCEILKSLRKIKNFESWNKNIFPYLQHMLNIDLILYIDFHFLYCLFARIKYFLFLSEK